MGVLVLSPSQPNRKGEKAFPFIAPDLAPRLHHTGDLCRCYGPVSETGDLREQLC